jgi:hypothetical protein
MLDNPEYRNDTGAEVPRASAVRPLRRHALYKSPALASVLSLFPGLGQAYIGYYQRGFAHAVVMALCITLLNSGLGTLTPFVALFLAFFWMFNIIDAGRRTALYNLALEGAGAIEMPKDMKLPAGGSLMGGLLLIAGGALLFAHTRYDYSLDWLEDWWPVGLVLYGVYLIVGWWRGRRREA